MQGSKTCAFNGHRPPHDNQCCRSSDRFTLLTSELIRGTGFLGMFIALRHSCTCVLVQYTLPKSGLTLKASYVVSLVNTSGPVRLPLRSSPRSLYICFRCSVIHLERMETVRASDSTSHFFLSMPSPLPRVPRECSFPLLPHERWPSSNP